MGISRPVNQISGKQVNKPHHIYLFTCLLISLFSLSGCVTLPDPETTQDFNKNSVAQVSPGQTVGQTFVSRHARLNGIDLWLQTDSPGQLVKIELFHKIGDPNPVFEGYFSTTNGKTRIKIPPQDTPPNQTFYLRLISSQGEVSLLGRDEDNYPSGTATINDLPINADIAFRATYDYDKESVFKDLRSFLSRIYLIIPLVIILLLPGWLLLDIINLKGQFDWGERIAISLGISLATIPLLMLWTSLIGLRWGPISVWLVSCFLVGISFWQWYSNFRTKRDKDQEIKESSIAEDGTTPKGFETLDSDLPLPISIPQSPYIFPHSASILLAAIFSLTMLTRIAMVRDLAAPPWVDSIHHGLITRLMMESGGLPETYIPHLPPEADFYHFGFHSALSVFIWLTGFEIHSGMLIVGQVLNALIVFAVYLLSHSITKNRITALAAALIAGVFTLMPAYYTSWGRYTQLAGLLILPVGLRIFIEITNFKTPSTFRKITLWTLGAVTFTGLFLTHYRVAAFLILLIFAYLIAQIKPRGWVTAIGQFALLSGLSVILLIPWLPGMIQNLLLPKGYAWTGGAANFSQIPWNFIKPGFGITALVLAGIGLALGIILLKRFTITILLWTGLIYLMANLGKFGVPGSGFINPVSMEITLFIPISVLGGYAAGGTLEFLDKFTPYRWQIVSRVILIIVGAGAAILGTRQLIPTLNPITFLAREADFPAIDWINKNIPEDETILINPTGWGYGLYMGHDGGYWIAPLTGRQTMPPPVLYGFGERLGIDRINQIVESVLPIGKDANRLWQLLRSEDIQFVYSGGRGGILSPQALAESGLFVVRYHQDGTWLFETLESKP